MRRLVTILLAAAISLTGCSDEGRPRSDDPWDQNWFLDSIRTSEGTIDAAGMPNSPGVEFRPALQGSDGCDRFEGSYDFTEPVLTFLRIEYTYSEQNPVPAPCPDKWLPIVEAVRGALADGVEVTELSADSMVWRWEEGDTEFEFYPGLEG